MRLQLWFDKVSSNGDLKEKVFKKFSQVEKYLKDVSEDLKKGFVSLSKGDRWGYKVKMGVKIPGAEVVAEAKDETLLSAVDEASGKLAREVRKRLEKLKGRVKRR